MVSHKGPSRGRLDLTRALVTYDDGGVQALDNGIGYVRAERVLRHTTRDMMGAIRR